MRMFFSSYYFKFSPFTLFFLFLLAKKRFLEISNFRVILKEKCDNRTTESFKLSKMKETTEKEKKYPVVKRELKF